MPPTTQSTSSSFATFRKPRGAPSLPVGRAQERGQDCCDPTQAGADQLQQGGGDTSSGVKLESCGRCVASGSGKRRTHQGLQTRRRRFPGVPTGARRASPRPNHDVRAANGPSDIPKRDVRHVGVGHALARDDSEPSAPFIYRPRSGARLASRSRVSPCRQRCRRRANLPPEYASGLRSP
jgi:hypothetical protein